MEYDQRDRRESSDADDAAWQPADSRPPTESSEGTTPEPGAPAEIESWPSREPAPATPDEPTYHADPAWPTEPPAAGTGGDEAWPTAAPEAGLDRADDDRPADPAWSEGDATSAAPPPPEVEAYPAAAGASDVRDDEAAGATAAHAVPAAESAVGESTQCPRCGTENRPGLAFCRNCGQRLVAAGVATTIDRPGAPEGTQACPRCGTHNRAGVAFCQNCGANLRGTAPGYVPPSVATDEAPAAAAVERRAAVLGPVVLLIGLVGLVTGYLLPFLYGSGSLSERAMGDGGYGIAFWAGYPEVGAALADQAYFGLAGPVPLLGLLLVGLAIAGFVRASPGPIGTIGLAIALLWAVGLAILFVFVELAGNWSGDLVAMLRDLSPAGIIFFLASLIIIIGTLTRFARS